MEAGEAAIGLGEMTDVTLNLEPIQEVLQQLGPRNEQGSCNSPWRPQAGGVLKYVRIRLLCRKSIIMYLETSLSVAAFLTDELSSKFQPRVDVCAFLLVF